MPTLKIKNKKITLKQCIELSELLEEFYISSTWYICVNLDSSQERAQWARNFKTTKSMFLQNLQK